jgi:hypothetical protein
MTNGEPDVEDILKAQAANAVMWQKQAQAGAEMRAWVEAGHFDFIQTRILAPIELECFKKVKSVRLGPAGVQNIAKVQGTLEVFDKISARIANAIQTGQDALDHLKDLENSTQGGRINGNED